MRKLRGCIGTHHVGLRWGSERRAVLPCSKRGVYIYRMDIVGWIPRKVTLNQRLVCELIRGALGNQDLLGRDWVEGEVGRQCGYAHGELCSYNCPLELTPFGTWRLDFHGPMSTSHQMQVDPGKWVRLWLRWLHSANLRAIPKS